jgi:phenylacetic acid degradation operon negative regulatory protein
VLPASEQWLDRHATDENGRLPPAGADLKRRFEE